jgi:hypothetical protein
MVQSSSSFGTAGIGVVVVIMAGLGSITQRRA